MKILKTGLILVVAAMVLCGPAIGHSAGYKNFAILIDQSNEMHVNHNNKSKNFRARETAEKLLIHIAEVGVPLKGAIYMYGIQAAETENRVHKVQRWTPFELGAFKLGLGKVDKQYGPSTLSVALRKLSDDMGHDGITGPTAVFVISGGNLSDVDSAENRAKELKQAHPDVCIYTILIGKSKLGGKNLGKVEKKGKCGFPVNGDSIKSGKDNRRYVEGIFKGTTGDSDNDGVDDSNDQCPGTPFGAGVDYRGCWVVNNITFDSGKADIKSMYGPYLNEIAGVINANPDLIIRLEGHTDSDGGDASNQKLSEARANAVMRHLITAEVEPSRISAMGWGESRPVADNSSSAGKAQNRRIEFVIQRR